MRRALTALALWAVPTVRGTLARAQGAADGVSVTQGRFTVLSAPGDVGLARRLLADASRDDRFPGLPGSSKPVRIIIAANGAQFRALIGTGAPEWGVAFALPEERTVIMHGAATGSASGDPRTVLRHELAHLALHDHLGAVPPRWFDEGYASFAAGEVTRTEALATSVALVARGVPSLDSLDAWFAGDATSAGEAYALAHTAVAELQALDPTRGLDRFLSIWGETLSYERAMRGAYGLTAADFDRRFRAAVRRRFGVLALVANLSLAIGFLTMVLAPLYVMRRRRDRARLEALRAADAVQEREAQMLAALLAVEHGGGDQPAGPESAPTGPVPGAPGPGIPGQR